MVPPLMSLRAEGEAITPTLLNKGRNKKGDLEARDCLVAEFTPSDDEAPCNDIQVGQAQGSALTISWGWRPERCQQGDPNNCFGFLSIYARRHSQNLVPLLLKVLVLLLSEGCHPPLLKVYFNSVTLLHLRGGV